MLTPDFCGDLDAVARVLDAGPHVFNHNMETVPRLYRRVRPQADYQQSLDVLRFARRHAPNLTKSGLMVGLGETEEKFKPCCATCAPPARTSPPSANTCSPPAAICRWPSYIEPEQFEAYRDYGLRSASRWSSAARWCAVPTWRTW